VSVSFAVGRVERAPEPVEPQGLFHVPYLPAERCRAVASALSRDDVGGLVDEYGELVVSPGVLALRVAAIDNVPEWKRNQRLRSSSRRGCVTAWSVRSRRRMVRTLAECTFDGHGWAMVTLTYPGAWEQCAPSPKIAHDHVRTLQKRWERRWGVCEAAWKLEFQRRGAPHFHLLVRIRSVALPVMRAWVAAQWFDIVKSGDERHLRAGTAVDVSWRGWEGSAAVARYFAKHGIWATKEYQHDVPEEWETSGRWWGVWNLERVRQVVQLDDDAVVSARRLLRKWFRANHDRRLVVHGVEVHNGRAVVRVGYRGGRLRSLQGNAGAFVLCRDGPNLAHAIGRALGLIEGGEPCKLPRSCVRTAAPSATGTTSVTS
jgi:hypothetical protein